MKKAVTAGVLAAIILVGNLPLASIGQDNPADTPEAKAETIRRLPPGYSEIITNSQRRSIYTIQERYQSQIDDLQKQIASIQSQRDSEVAQILDDEQKQVLAFILKIRERNRAEEAEQPVVAGE